MSLLRVVLCVLLPPAAVADKGLGSFVIVTALWLMGWIPGIIGAVIVCLKKKEDN